MYELNMCFMKKKKVNVGLAFLFVLLQVVSLFPVLA